MMAEVQGLAAGSIFKVPLACCLTFFTNIMLGDVAVLEVFVIFSVLEFFLRIANAVKNGEHASECFYLWSRRFGVYILLGVLIGLACHALYLTVGVTISIINWLMFCCIITDLALIIEQLDALGVPVPIAIHKIIVLMKKQTAKKISRTIGDPSAYKDISEILGVDARSQKIVPGENGNFDEVNMEYNDRDRHKDRYTVIEKGREQDRNRKQKQGNEWDRDEY